MAGEINSDLAFAKQYFEELTSLADIDSLERGDWGTGYKLQRIRILLTELVALSLRIDKAFAALLDEAVPIMNLPSGLKDFYHSLLKPNSDKLINIWLKIMGLPEEAKAYQTGLNQSPASGKRPIASAISEALDRWFTNLDEGELEDLQERGLNLKDADDIVNKIFFDPDLWLKNSLLLSPVLVGRPLNTVPTHIRIRLSEMYNAFKYNLSMSAIALSRSVAEYAIIDNAKRLGIDPTYERKGKREYKRFEILAEDVSELRPELSDPLEMVRQTGNRILHPKKMRGGEITSIPKIMQKDALACMTNTKFIVEDLYSV